MWPFSQFQLRFLKFCLFLLYILLLINHFERSSFSNFFSKFFEILASRSEAVSLSTFQHWLRASAEHDRSETILLVYQDIIYWQEELSLSEFNWKKVSPNLLCLQLNSRWSGFKSLQYQVFNRNDRTNKKKFTWSRIRTDNLQLNFKRFVNIPSFPFQLLIPLVNMQRE